MATTTDRGIDESVAQVVLGMSFQQRGRNKYYYRSTRVGPKVSSRYVGQGALAEAVHLDVLYRRAAARERKRLQQQLLAAARDLEALTRQLSSECEVLVRAHLLLAGYHLHHRHEWRKRRESATNPPQPSRQCHCAKGFTS